ncbi:MAG: acetate--CoA ligase family protein, partial [Anaerolineae bacterium]|nr:acetate--CoA ligase family protein [Anaerolineae bacterium]
ILALKVGRYKGGQEAVASHTGALAGEERAFNAAFRRAGVIRADTSEEMFDWARALAWCPPPKGRRVAVLTNAGGPGVTAVDALEGMGLSLSQFSADTTTKLKELLPPAASVGNPVDMLATASPDQYRQCLQVLLKDEGVDSVLVILPPPPAYTSAGVANAMIPVIQTTSKPVLVALMGERLIQEAVVRLRAAHIPEYRFPERAASALNVLVRREESLQRKAAETVQRTDVDKQAVQRLLDDQPAGDFLPTEISHGILKAYGLPVLEMHLAQTKDQAAALADKVGFPVVMKIASPDIQHKSDMGGVLVNLETAEQVAEGYDRLMQIAAKAGEGINILGVHIQKMAPKGQEIIVGAVRDAQFGALVMFGSGGVEVEGLKDVEFSLAPVTQDDISSMFDNTWAGQRMAGFRNLPAGDRTAVEDALIRIGQLAADFPQLAEIEMNPMTVLENGKGAVAVDVRIKVKS